MIPSMLQEDDLPATLDLMLVEDSRSRETPEYRWGQVASGLTHWSHTLVLRLLNGSIGEWIDLDECHLEGFSIKPVARMFLKHEGEKEVEREVAFGQYRLARDLLQVCIDPEEFRRIHYSVELPEYRGEVTVWGKVVLGKPPQLS